MVSPSTPPAEFEVDADLVRRLIAAQHPDLSGLAIEPFDAGWDNAMFRLGPSLAVRLPRRTSAAALVVHEQRWLPTIAGTLPIAVPAPVRIGEPGEGYPWRWSVLPWIAGTAADLAPPRDGEAARFAHFLEHLHVKAPVDAPANPVRGVPLANRAAVVEARLVRLEARTTLVTPAVRRAWSSALDAPAAGAATWIHGDLHPRNVLVGSDGTITGIVDWGDMAAGDKATDLAAVWMLFGTAESRAVAQAAYPDRSQALWARARGWAIAIGAVLLETGLEDHPRHARIGELTLARIAEDG